MTPETPTPETDADYKEAQDFERSALVEPLDKFLKLERERDAARAQIEVMREAIREALAMLLELEYEGNDKGTRCIICGMHCCEPHEVDCVMHQAIQKLKPFIKP